MTFAQLLELTRSENAGAIVVRGLVWLIGVLLVAAAVDKKKDEKGIRVDVGWFFLFLCTAGILSYVIFGFVPTF